MRDRKWLWLVPILLIMLIVPIALRTKASVIDAPAAPIANALDANGNEGDLSGELVVNLPEDGHVWQTIIFTSDNWMQNPKERQFVAWFKADPKLQALCRQTKFHHITPKKVVYKYRFTGVVHDSFPCVIVQTCNGHKVYKTSGKNVPKSAPALASQISAKLSQYKVEPIARDTVLVAKMSSTTTPPVPAPVSMPNAVVRTRSVKTPHVVKTVSVTRPHDCDPCTPRVTKEVTVNTPVKVVTLDVNKPIGATAGDAEAGRIRPRPKPCPEPNPAVDPVVPQPTPNEVPVLDDVEEEPAPAEGGNIGLVVLFGAIGAAACVVYMLNQK